MDLAYLNKSVALVVPLRCECWAFPAEIVDLSDAELIALGFLGESEPLRHYTHQSHTRYCPSAL